MGISITTIPLNVDLASDEIGMAFVNMHVPATKTAPFTIIPSARDRAATTFRTCLLASLTAIEGIPNPQVVVFPELSLPFEAISAVRDALESAACPPNTIIIAGIEWLTAGQYIELLESSNVPEKVKSKHPDAHLYVNCATIWAKCKDGRLLRYVQPKLRPSPPEEASQLMYRGQDVLIFTSNQPEAIALGVLICFDCIAEKGQTAMFDQLRAAAPRPAPNSSFNWRLLLVPQHNNDPEHDEFHDFAEAFLWNGSPNYNTADSAVAFINSAYESHGRSTRGFGRSSIYYRANRWQESTPDGPLNRIPGTYAVETLRPGLMRARFREDGPSVHRFSFVKPWITTKHSGASRVPLLNAMSAKIDSAGNLGEWQSVPVLSKVFTDWLTDDLAATDPAFFARVDILDEFSRIRQALLDLATERVDRLVADVELLMLAHKNPCAGGKFNPDTWQQPTEDWRDDDHGKAIVQLAMVSTLLELAATVQFDHSSPVSTGTLGETHFAVVDGCGVYNDEMLISKYAAFLSDHPWGDIAGKTVIVILTRSTTTYLKTGSSTAEEITSLTELASSEDQDTLRRINPDLATSPDDITADRTRFFKHFAALLGRALLEDSKIAATQFLRSRLGEAI
jgi:predicted amidohydrolase